MALQIVIPFDPKLWRQPAMKRAIWNSAKFLRDLWLSRSPTLGGDYAKGLQRPSSIVITPGKIIVQNFSKHARIYEDGARSFNWGLATLAKGKNVKRTKAGDKFKVIFIKPTGRVAFRRPTVGNAVIAAFRATIPKGRTTFASYSGPKDLARYKSRASLAKPIKAKKPLKGAMKGFFVVSERAIRENPKRWFHERLEGHHLARDVEREALPIIERALAQAAAAEAAARERNRPRGR